ncbi:MAG: hypothetical protein WDW38_000485 [Sanguina aurantia]
MAREFESSAAFPAPTAATAPAERHWQQMAGSSAQPVLTTPSPTELPPSQPSLIFAPLFDTVVLAWTGRTVPTVIVQPQNDTERWLLDTVRHHAQQAGIGMPEVAIYEAPEMNAFATGMSRNNALVAVSSGLLQQMDREQVKAVLGHEIGHIANGDMVTLTLIQGVLNTLVILAARIIGRAVDSWLSGGGVDHPKQHRHFGISLKTIV